MSPLPGSELDAQAHARAVGALAALPPGPPRDELRPLLHPRAGQRRLLARAVRRALPAAPAAWRVPAPAAARARARPGGRAASPRRAPGPRPRPRRRRLLLQRRSADCRAHGRQRGSGGNGRLSPRAELRRHAAAVMPSTTTRRRRNGAESAHGADEGIASAHDRIAFKHAIAPTSSCPTPRHATRSATAGTVPARCRGAVELCGETPRRHRRGVRGARRRDADRQVDCARRRNRHPCAIAVRDGAGGRLSTRSTSRCRAATASRAAISSAGRFPAASGSRSISSGRAKSCSTTGTCAGAWCWRLDAPARVAARPTHSVAVGGRLRARDAVGDAGDRVDRGGRCRRARGASHHLQRSTLVPGGAGGDGPSARVTGRDAASRPDAALTSWCRSPWRRWRAACSPPCCSPSPG